MPPIRFVLYSHMDIAPGIFKCSPSSSAGDLLTTRLYSVLPGIKSLKPIVIFCVLPPAIEPLPVTFCKVDGGRTPISVASSNFSPSPFTTTFTCAIPIDGSATILNKALPSLLAANDTDWLFPPTTFTEPSVLILAVTLAAFCSCIAHRHRYIHRIARA